MFCLKSTHPTVAELRGITIKLTKMSFSFIFIGSTHGFIDDFLKQKEIIEEVKPEIVLCEELENLELDSKEKFNELFQKKEISNMTSFNEVEKLVKLCFDKNIKLIGIDFHNFEFNEDSQKKIKTQTELTKDEEKNIKKIIKLREKKHLNKILEYQGKTSRPLVIIVGCWHLRKSSLLRKKLKNYKIIIPSDEKGNPLFSPKEVKEVKYTEITSGDNKKSKQPKARP